MSSLFPCKVDQVSFSFGTCCFLFSRSESFQERNLVFGLSSVLMRRASKKTTRLLVEFSVQERLASLLAGKWQIAWKLVIDDHHGFLVGIAAAHGRVRASKPTP